MIIFLQSISWWQQILIAAPCAWIIMFVCNLLRFAFWGIVNPKRLEKIIEERLKKMQK